MYVIIFFFFFHTVFVGILSSMSCKNCNGVSCHYRQVPDQDKEYKDGEEKTTLEQQKR